MHQNQQFLLQFGQRRVPLPELSALQLSQSQHHCPRYGPVEQQYNTLTDLFSSKIIRFTDQFEQIPITDQLKNKIYKSVVGKIIPSTDQFNIEIIPFVDQLTSKIISFIDQLNSMIISFTDQLNSKIISFTDQLNSKIISFIDQLNSKTS